MSKSQRVRLLKTKEAYMRSLGCFIAVTIFLSVMASASSTPQPIEVKVLKAESYTFKSPPIIPRDCNWQDLSAYCYGSKPVGYVENTMVVREPDGRSLQIACTAYNRWSHCTDLPVNSTFEAKMERHGLDIRYLDQNQKMRKQLYEILRENQGSR
jgi:hypothetical protein